MYILALTAILLPTAITAQPIRWNLNNVAGMRAWGDLIKPHVDELVDIADNNVVTILIPSDSAVNEYTSSSRFQGQNSAGIRELMRYHILRGQHDTKGIVAAGPVLRTMLNQPNISGGQRVLVSSMMSGDGGEDEVVFYSGMAQSSPIWEYGGDFDADGTTLHIIDKVLTIPLTLSETALAADLTSFAGVVTTVNANLDSVEDATYFIPTNDAFETVGSAMNDASDSELQNIVDYHYLNSSSPPLYTSMIDSAQHETAAGRNIELSYSDGNDLFVNSAAITHTNILVANGVMHIIDQVLNPSSNSTQQPAGSIGLSAFPNASRTGSPPFTNAVAGVSDSSGMSLGSGPAETPLGRLAPGYDRQREQIQENLSISFKRFGGTFVALLGIAVGVAVVM